MLDQLFKKGAYAPCIILNVSIECYITICPASTQKFITKLVDPTNTMIVIHNYKYLRPYLPPIIWQTNYPGEYIIDLSNPNSIQELGQLLNSIIKDHKILGA